MANNGAKHSLEIESRADGLANLAQRFSAPNRPRHSPVRASNSLNSRTFSIAITAWSAKVSSSLICAGVKGRTSMRRAVSPSNEFPLLTKRNGQEATPAADIYDLEIVLLADVGNVERAVLAHPAIS